MGWNTFKISSTSWGRKACKKARLPHWVEKSAIQASPPHEVESIKIVSTSLGGGAGNIGAYTSWGFVVLNCLHLWDGGICGFLLVFECFVGFEGFEVFKVFKG